MLLAGAGRRPDVSSLAARWAQPRPIPVTVWRRVEVDVTTAFDAIVPIDLASVFTGFGPLPAVIGTEQGDGVWGSTVGQARTVLLADGGRLSERVTEAHRPGLFAYEVRPEQGSLRHVVHRIDGRFVFAASEAGGTVIRWTYLFRPRRGAGLAARALTPVWRAYADRVLARLADAARAGAAPKAPAAADAGRAQAPSAPIVTD